MESLSTLNFLLVKVPLNPDSQVSEYSNIEQYIKIQIVSLNSKFDQCLYDEKLIWKQFHDWHHVSLRVVALHVYMAALWQDKSGTLQIIMHLKYQLNFQLHVFSGRISDSNNSKLDLRTPLQLHNILWNICICKLQCNKLLSFFCSQSLRYVARSVTLVTGGSSNSTSLSSRPPFVGGDYRRGLIVVVLAQ